MKRICLYVFIAFSLIALVSCSAKDDSNALINTQFAPEIIDSCRIFSPKTYSYLHNVKPPLGVKPVVVVVDKIEESRMGTYADDLFDQFCDKKYSGNSFNQRGILIVASKSPELVQVRVGKTYAIYCRMRGSAGGANYLDMQKETQERGINEICPVALRNVIADIEECRNLSWYKKVSLKLSSTHIEMLMDDVATPSESFFSQFYFRPFLFVVGIVKSVFGSWILSFLFIAISYTLTKNWCEDKLNAYIVRKASQESSSDEDYVATLGLYQLVKTIVVFILKLIITVPTLAAISLLSTSRMEDIIALRDANIPSVGLTEGITHWTNSTPGLWIVFMLMIVYYLKFLFCDKGCFALGHLPDGAQQQVYNNSPRYRMLLDTAISYGYNRRLVQKLFKGLFNILLSATMHHNFQELDTVEVDDNSTETDDKGKPQKRLIDLFFLDTDAPLYKQSPALALQVNTHREALYLTFFVGIIATAVLSFTYALYFLTLWTVQLAVRMIVEYFYARKYFGVKFKELDLFRLLKEIWKTDVVFLAVMAALYLVLSPSYVNKTTEPVVEVQKALPDEFTGLYFVSKIDGENVKGVTARLIKDESDNYIMQVYSDKPIRRIPITLDKEIGLFHSDILGDGYITYDKQTKSIKINFSDLWILTN